MPSLHHRQDPNTWHPKRTICVAIPCRNQSIPPPPMQGQKEACSRPGYHVIVPLEPHSRGSSHRSSIKEQPLLEVFSPQKLLFDSLARRRHARHVGLRSRGPMRKLVHMSVHWRDVVRTLMVFSSRPRPSSLLVRNSLIFRRWSPWS